MQSADFPRPPTLYRYSRRHWLERSLTSGEFRLRPAQSGMPSPIGAQLKLRAPLIARAGAGGNYLTLSMATVWNEHLFDALPRADCCLVIHDSEQFGERLHRAVQKLLPDWAGIDAAMCYGQASPLGAAFSKGAQLASQQEWLFAWRPLQAAVTLSPLVIRIGNIEDFAELREKSGSLRTA